MADIDRVLRSNLKLRHLQLLVALDEFRHLGRAAEFLSVTQPAVSKVLAEIERMFALQLFTRSTRGTEPTAYGATVVRFARSVLADYQRTREEIAAVASGGAGRVSVGAMVVAMPGLLVDGVRLLKQRSALTAVLVEEGDLTRLLPRLRVGELDLIVGRLEPGYASPDLETEALYTERMCIVVHRDHPLATRRRKPGWAELAGQPWVMPPPWASSRIKLNQQFYRHQLVPPADVVETASFLATFAFVRDLQAVGFVAETVAQRFEAEGFHAIALPVPIELPPVGVITLRGRRRPPAAVQLLECLREATVRHGLPRARRAVASIGRPKT
ncbi:LysR substrate-binding domain-containing protein [Pseudacidovorax intermedius]|nr:LysR substrate-binding domain-containing protein [Pseudacidovorax intermedius]